ncbi:hypothetical protein [Mucilaginibacter sp. OK098]|uniref:hypothetical protein n=1 Tax=Mucilaginibacter sp. OK098 TaxID=1855297 RepID=UPI000920F68A|nr:hypothetical protein [Mucilaginibacter sp. OK098]SHM16416.1 hypothetical protein SAMN05216524_1011024 [Mucilaginibacter sp. OK098]
MDQLFNFGNLITLLIFLIYELFYKIFVVNKIEWRVKRDILKEQTDIVESNKAIYNEKLETIKAQNAGENDKLKHALDKLLTLQLQHRTEERQALVNFSENCNRWIFNLSRIKFENYNVRNIEELKQKIDGIRDEYFLNIYVDRVKIILFITNEYVNNEMNTLAEAIEKYKYDMESILNELLGLLNEQYNSRYEVEILDEFGEGIMTEYSVNNTSKIKELFLVFEDFNGKSFGNCRKQIESFALSAKLYLTSSEFNRQ